MADENKPAGAPKETKAVVRRPSAQKRHLQSLKRQAINRGFNSKVRTAIRAFETSLAQGDKGVIQKALNEVYSLVDKGVKTNKFKLNTAARTKARLTKKALAK
jgi:small subunit ribosomal protein S20